jgi:hypothetical protein
LPIRALLPALERFVFEFCREIESMLTRSLTGGDPQRAFAPCAAAIDAFWQDQFRYGMSFPSPRRGIGDVTPLILVNPDVRRPLEAVIEHRLRPHVQDCEMLRGRLSVAVVFEETVLSDGEVFAARAALETRP